MPTQGSPSMLANAQAMRSRLAAARSRMGMEGQGANPGSNLMPQRGMMTPASPTPPAQPPAAVVGPAAQAVMGTPTPTIPQQPGAQAGPSGQPMPGGFHPVDESNVQPPPDGQQFPLTQDPAQHQDMMSKVSAFLNQHGAQQQALIDKTKQPNGNVTSIKDFQEKTGRIPSPHELLIMAAQARLQQQLGRPPTDQELASYFQPGAAPTAATPEDTTQETPDTEEQGP